MAFQLRLDDPYFQRKLDGKVKPRKVIAQVSKLCTEMCKKLDTLPLTELVSTLNAVRRELHKHSPFSTEPVDFVEWVDADIVQANSYNPNVVAPVEKELLRLSIEADGYTQPIVSNVEDEHREVVDGFHRHLVGKTCSDIQARIHGYLPLVQIRGSQTDKSDRIASTIRHNRARGKHTVTGMSDIVLELKRRNWNDEKIGKQLGMDPDEVLRLAQLGGLAEMFTNRDFSEAWEAGTVDGDIELSDDDLGSEMDGAIANGSQIEADISPLRKARRRPNVANGRGL